MSDDLTVGHLRLRLPPSLSPTERAEWRRQALGALDFAALTPRGLPESAILVVRRLHDPAPGALWDGQPSVAGGRWGQAARGALESLWRTAARPALEPVPLDASAVWFADRAEWLACFTLDLYYGVAAARWWWQTWMGVGTLRASPTIATLWQNETTWLPAALALIAAQSPPTALEVAAAVPPTNAQVIARTLATSHHLPSVLTDLAPETTRRLLAALPEVWRAWLTPTITPNLTRTPAGVGLIILAVTAHHAPAAARQVAHERSPLPQPAPTNTPPSAPSRAARPIESVPAPTSPRAISPPADDAATSFIAAAEAPIESAPTLQEAAQGRESALEPPIEPLTPDDAPAETPLPLEQAQDVSAHAPDAPFTFAPGLLPSDAAAHEGTLTSFGGVWYLVNLLVALDLLDDVSGVTGWHMLLALAWAYLGELPPDPLWQILNDLAGDASADLDAWLERNVETVNAWLSDRLEQPERLPELLAQPTRLFVTRTHIDVYFTLDQIDLDARLAGLDRDPGWVAALGRVILFHFV